MLASTSNGEDGDGKRERRGSDAGVVDLKQPGGAKPDVGVKAKASSMANTLASLRSGAESLKQVPLRSGELMTMSMANAIR
jgi:hypothetical protein